MNARGVTPSARTHALGANYARPRRKLQPVRPAPHGRRISTLVSTSPLLVLAESVPSPPSTLSLEASRAISVSLPPSPKRLSTPLPPSMLSFPSPPLMLSFPAPPLSVLGDADPTITSLPEPPI